jgi:hypothetical protein
VKSKSPRSKFSRNARPVPNDLVGVLLCVPDDVNLGEIQWHDEMPGRILEPASVVAPALQERTAAEVERVMALPPAEFKKWIAEQQQRNDALLASPMCWGGAL